MSVEPEDEFQKELIKAFVQEAQEWLQQIHVALDELQQEPASDRRARLLQSIQTGIANMGGSAATIGLSDVEQASFSALPFVDIIRNRTAGDSPSDFLALCKQLGRIHTALTRSTGVAFDDEIAPERAEKDPVSTPISDVLARLRRFQDSKPGSGAGSRHILHTVIAQVEGLQRNGEERCDVRSLKEFLERRSDGEEEFLDGVRKQIPAITDVLQVLKSEGGEARGFADRLRVIVDRTAQLCSDAQQVGAPQTTEFFTGLHRFLTVIMRRRILVAAHKCDAVESRMCEILKALQIWVEAGRMERSAISGVMLR